MTESRSYYVVFVYSQTGPYTSDSLADLRRRGRWFDPRLGHYSFRGFMMVIATISLSCFDNGHVGKQTLAWKEY